MTGKPIRFRDLVLARIDELGISMAEASRIASVSPNILRDLKRRETGSTDVENAKKLAVALNIPGFGETQESFDQRAKSNNLRQLRRALGFSEAEMARQLKMDPTEYIAVEDPDQYPEAPRHIDMAINELLDNRTQASSAQEVEPLKTGDIKLSLLDEQLHVHAIVDAESIDRLIAKLEGMRAVLSS